MDGGESFPLSVGETEKTNVVVSLSPEHTSVIKARLYSQLMSLGDAFTKCLHDKKDVWTQKSD